jgi:hypothetical protein
LASYNQFFTFKAIFFFLLNIIPQKATHSQRFAALCHYQAINITLGKKFNKMFYQRVSADS